MSASVIVGIEPGAPIDVRHAPDTRRPDRVAIHLRDGAIFVNVPDARRLIAALESAVADYEQSAYAVLEELDRGPAYAR